MNCFFLNFVNTFLKKNNNKSFIKKTILIHFYKSKYYYFIKKINFKTYFNYFLIYFSFLMCHISNFQSKKSMAG
jgi:hypothetical protein